MMLLNSGYDTDRFDTNNNLLNEHNRSYYWNSTGISSSPLNCYAGVSNATTTCYFNNNGIKNDITRGLISESLWYLRGWNSNSVFSDQIYEYERITGDVYNTSRSTTWTGKIAIPYPSDYGYAADFRSCKVYLSKYNDTLCAGVNWITSLITSNVWLLTPNSDSNCRGFSLNKNGYVSYTVYISSSLQINPVLHLNPELSIKSGDGSQDTPYQLEVE